MTRTAPVAAEWDADAEASPAAMAAIHAAAMAPNRPWSEAEILALLASPGVFAVTCATGFALGRVVADEAELLTLAVDPAARRRGTGRRLLAAVEARAAAEGAATIWLEVAADNVAARALYAAAGWRQTGLRRGYYAHGGAAVDALVLSRGLAGTPPGRWRAVAGGDGCGR